MGIPKSGHLGHNINSFLAHSITIGVEKAGLLANY